MNAVEEIKQRIDIVDLVGSYVPLTKSGRNYKGLCPFHSEKTPSFIVFPETQGWHCFGACSTGGDIFSFVMRRENMDFSETLRFLADRAGVELRPLGVEEIRERDELEHLRLVNAAAGEHYHEVLIERPEGEQARLYLGRRGVTRETMATFQLGYAVDEWHALEDALRRRKLAPEDLLAAGLTVKGESGSIYDRFRGRLIFPIRDIHSQVVGFGGRVLDSSQPKYLNTPDTPLFSKGSVLYGIDQAREHIRTTGTAVVVEGYMDVIIPYQCGVRNLVACLGTALTETHLQMLKRVTRRLVLALDPDAAGMQAVERGVETAQKALERKVVPVPLATGLIRYEEQLAAEIRILMLPDGLDPDELVLRDRAEWDRLVDGALGVVDFHFQAALGDETPTTAKAKRAIADRLLPIIAAVDNPIERAHHLQRLAQRLRTDERTLAGELERMRSGEGSAAPVRSVKRRPQPEPAGASDQVARIGPEEHFLALLIRTPSCYAEVAEATGLTGEAFLDIRNRQVFELVGRRAEQPSDGPQASVPALEPGDVLDSALSAHVESLLQALNAAPQLSPETVREALIKSASRLRKSHLSTLIRELQFLQQDAQDEGAEGRVRELCQTIDVLKKRRLEVDRDAHAATMAGRRRGERILRSGGPQDAF